MPFIWYLSILIQVKSVAMPLNSLEYRTKPVLRFYFCYSFANLKDEGLALLLCFSK